MSSAPKISKSPFRLIDHIVELARANPSQPALLTCDSAGTIEEEISRSALLTKVEEAAAYLQSKGLCAGDRVALEFGNCADLLILSWAAWSMGIVTVPLDTKRDTAELRAFKLRASGAKLVLKREEWPALPMGNISWMPDLSHDALILFTSGTTAYPKGARLTLQNLVVNAEGIIEWLHIQEDDRFLVELPLHHINSTTFCLASLIAGASIAIPPVYSNSRFFEHATNSSSTLTSIVPSIVFDQLGRTKEFKAVQNRLKLSRIQLGSAPVAASAAAEFIRAYGIPLYQGYGQTETALRVTGVPMDMSAPVYEELVTENSIGTPMQWANVEITDASGHILGEGEEGELVVKGSAVMQGYIGGEKAFRDGYFLTGDIGYWKKKEGRRFFFLIGRSKEIVIKGGINISPIAVENALKKVSADIEQAYAVGVEDERYGEEVGAAIVWKNGAEPERAMRRLKIALLVGHEALSAYETPNHLITIRAEELPMTSTGKVQRSILKKTLGGTMDSLYELMYSTEFRFVVISPQSPFAMASHALHNHCWQPLTQNGREYKKYLGDYMTLGAIDKHNSLAGQISFLYADEKITCVSICSAMFKPKSVPEVTEMPDAEFVRNYVLGGNDPVMNFHQKLGAELIEVTPRGRPEDKSSLGYTMLLLYPSLDNPALEGLVSNQLIAAVRLLARDLGAKVFAVSRPGGLAAYLSKR